MKFLLFTLLFFFCGLLRSQQTDKIPDSLLPPHFSVRIDKNLCFSTNDGLLKDKNNSILKNIQYSTEYDTTFFKVLKFDVTISNNSSDTIDFSNFVAYGENPEYTYITATGPWALARAKLCRPDAGPVDVTLPDNAWELGYTGFTTGSDESVCALARRISWEKAQRKRYETIIEPGGNVMYSVYIDTFEGDWQNGLKKMFQHHFLFDLDTFDFSLYQRKDLSWIRSSYLITLQFAWDHEFYDWATQEYTVNDFLKYPDHFGWYDVYGLWPTWPRLGLDERNQWDLYRDLPGGLGKLREIAAFANKSGTKFFISYNPWDKSTRFENPYTGMARLIDKLDADGVVLDTQGSSSAELQHAADSIKPGVIMYSEGMAVVKDMPGIISGRVHDAIYLQPVLNLNKLIKPDFAIFRVCQLSQGRIHRETCISFFNGYGTEINTFAPGRPDWINEEYTLLGKTTMLLRDNTDAFNSSKFTPFISSLSDSIWINCFPTENKTIYTILSFKPEGYTGRLFETNAKQGFHFVNLWKHEELANPVKNERYFIEVSVAPFSKTFTGTRSEGEIDCIAQFPELLNVTLKNDSLLLSSTTGNLIKLWKGNPSYEKKPLVFGNTDLKIRLHEAFGRYEGKIVIQLFNNNLLADERIIIRKQGKPVLISTLKRTRYNKKTAGDMIAIPAGEFYFFATNNDQFIPYPSNADSVKTTMQAFYMDKFPVTNRDYFEFLEASGYLPQDTTNYLKHWKNKRYLPEDADKPVVWVDLNDAKAYAEFTGKRLPTEAEWQYAAQGSDGRKWPWGNQQDTLMYNTSGRLMPSDYWPRANSPFGVKDLTGNVWQLTSDVYDNGSYNFVIIRGGSYFKPTSSWWYIQGGPQPLDKRQMMLVVGPGFDRNATIGFRCVMDRPLP
ncbi:MAG: formylglycine-generating enzyme family protein [Sphingobacteriia bacterium]|nr:formylglycine-generating enzyme family protein [Sphingobacteriia bacterium]